MGNTTDMTVGSPTRGILRFALPLILGYILQQMYLVIDAAIVGRWVGVEALAAIGASSSITFLIMGFCNGSCAGFAIPVAQTFGAHDYSKMRAYVAHSLRIGAVIAVVLTMLTAIFCARILRVVNTPDDIFHDAYIFLLLTFLTIPFTIAYNLLSGFIRALGNSRQPFYFLIVSSMVNIVLDVILILGMGMGVEGAGIATMLSQALAAVLCWVYIHRTLKMLIPHGDEWTYHDSMTGHLLNSGIPMGLQFSITGIGIIMLQSANNALGTDCVAAFTAAMRIKMFAICPCESLGIAMATFTGQNYGAGRPQRVWMGVKSSMAMVMVYVVAVSTAMLLWSEEMSLLFVSASDTAIIRNTALFLHVSAYMMPLLALLCVLRYTIQGAGFTNFAMLSGVMEMVARGMVSLVFVPDFGYIAVCFGDSVAWFAADIFLVPAFIYVYRRIRRDCTMPQTETAKSF